MSHQESSLWPPHARSQEVAYFLLWWHLGHQESAGGKLGIWSQAEVTGRSEAVAQGARVGSVLWVGQATTGHLPEPWIGGGGCHMDREPGGSEMDLGV